MDKYKIGRVIGVTGDSIDISLIDFTNENVEYGVPESMNININTESGKHHKKLQLRIHN